MLINFCRSSLLVSSVYGDLRYAGCWKKLLNMHTRSTCSLLFSFGRAVSVLEMKGLKFAFYSLDSRIAVSGDYLTTELA